MTLTARRFSVTVVAILAALGLLAAISSTQTEAAPAPLPTASPFVGKYAGGYWGNIPGVGPYGGDVTASVATDGKVTVTAPGAGTGTVSATGAYKVTGKLTVSGVSVNVTYTGKLTATKHPTTGAVLAVSGSGTWKTVAPPASGKWVVIRTSATP